MFERINNGYVCFSPSPRHQHLLASPRAHPFPTDSTFVLSYSHPSYPSMGGMFLSSACYVYFQAGIEQGATRKPIATANEKLVSPEQERTP